METLTSAVIIVIAIFIIAKIIKACYKSALKETRQHHAKKLASSIQNIADWLITEKDKKNNED